MKGLWTYGIILVTIIVMILLPAAAEEIFPPSPAPPEAFVDARPTPAPTAVPPKPVIDHVHEPQFYPDLTFQEDRKLLEIWIPNIRDSDLALILYDGDIWMLDCGDIRAGARGQLICRQLGIDHIDRIINTHPHHDHLDGLALINDTAKVGEVMICFPTDLTESGLRLVRVAEARGIPIREYRDGDRFAMGDGAVEWQIMKNNEESLDMNNQSAQIRIVYGQRSILFTADMEAAGQKAMLERIGDEPLRCDIVKYPHHGKTAMYEPFFEALGAELAVVTSIEGRGDPGQVYLMNKHLPAVYTFAKGRFTHLVTDGEYWLCEYVPITAE